MRSPERAPTFATDGEHYDALHANLVEDIEFWRDIAREADGPVLELACGTGRLTLPIAGDGVQIVGLDASPAYIDHARQKASKCSASVEWLVGDMRDFNFAGLFALCFVGFRSISVLGSLSEVEQCLRSARRHLRPGGVLVIDAFNDNAADVAHASIQSQFAYPHPRTGEQVVVERVRHYDAPTRLETSSFTVLGSETSSGSFSLTLRLHTTNELRAALNNCGFRVIKHWGNYGREARSESSRLQLLVAVSA